MKRIAKGIFAAMAFLLANAGMAEPVLLTPSNPQPSGLKAGLNVKYSYSETKFKTLDYARSLAKQNPQSGPPLRGLDYRDTKFGDMTLTSTAAWYLTATISGYFRFDAPGIYEIEFYTNDGLDASIGGQRVGYHDGIQGCMGTFVKQVEVPSAGWYDFEALYFQNAGTACLMMKTGKPGKNRKWVPNSAFGRK